jgi:hypothetical protein
VATLCRCRRKSGHSIDLGYRLFTSDRTLGALDLYSTKASAFDADAEGVGELFAAHAAIALIGSTQQTEWRTALSSRDTIGMAKGILMQRDRESDNPLMPLARSPVACAVAASLRGGWPRLLRPWRTASDVSADSQVAGSLAGSDRADGGYVGPTTPDVDLTWTEIGAEAHNEETRRSQWAYLPSSEVGVVELTTLTGDLTGASIDSLLGESRAACSRPSMDRRKAGRLVGPPMTREWAGAKMASRPAISPTDRSTGRTCDMICSSSHRRCGDRHIASLYSWRLITSATNAH